MQRTLKTTTTTSEDIQSILISPIPKLKSNEGIINIKELKAIFDSENKEKQNENHISNKNLNKQCHSIKESLNGINLEPIASKNRKQYVSHKSLGNYLFQRSNKYKALLKKSTHISEKKKSPI